MHFIQCLTIFLIFGFCERRNKFVFHIRELKYKFFLYLFKAESSLHMCVKFYFKHVCRAYKIFPIVYKIVIENKFFCKNFLFSLVHSKLKIFFYRIWNFNSIITNRILLMHFVRKWWSNSYLNKKLLNKEFF